MDCLVAILFETFHLMLTRLATQLPRLWSSNTGKIYFHGGRTLATLTLYHNATVTASVKTLELLEDARTNPYPKRINKKKNGASQPLSFDIDVRERSPTPEEFSDLMYMKQSGVYTVFLKEAASRSFKAHPTSAQSLYDMVQENPTVMRWPILVNYKTRQICMDHAAVRSLLKSLVRERDGEPKAPEPPAPRWTPPPKPEAWIDYD